MNEVASYMGFFVNVSLAPEIPLVQVKRWSPQRQHRWRNHVTQRIQTR
jgi:hypothetical protein